MFDKTGQLILLLFAFPGSNEYCGFGKGMLVKYLYNTELLPVGMKDMLPKKKKELEEKVKTYKDKLKKFEVRTKKLKKRNKELQEEKRKILKEKKEILEEQGDQIKTLIQKMSDEEIGPLSEDGEELIERLEREVFNLKEEVNELDEENDELLEELNKYESRSEHVIDTKEDLSVPMNSEIEGGIKCTGSLEIKDSVVIRGPVVSTEGIKAGDKVRFEGDVISKEGDVEMGDHTEIEGMVKGTFIHLGEKSSAEDIECEGDVVLEEETEVDNVVAEGDVTMKKSSRSNGKVEFGGEFDGAKGIKIAKSLKPLSRDEVEKELSG